MGLFGYKDDPSSLTGFTVFVLAVVVVVTVLLVWGLVRMKENGTPWFYEVRERQQGAEEAGDAGIFEGMYGDIE